MTAGSWVEMAGLLVSCSPRLLRLPAAPCPSLPHLGASIGMRHAMRSDGECLRALASLGTHRLLGRLLGRAHPYLDGNGDAEQVLAASLEQLMNLSVGSSECPLVVLASAIFLHDISSIACADGRDACKLEGGGE